MIYFLVNGKHAYTMQWFLEDWGRRLADHLRIVPYAEFLEAKRVPPGSYVFTDLERVTPAGTRRLETRWLQLERSRACHRMLNRPGQVPKRLALLNLLHDQGFNRFNAYPLRPGQRVVPMRFPVFVREANNHVGPYELDLIPDQQSLDEAVARYRAEGRITRNPVVIEFIDTANEAGLYRKFAAFRIGERIVPTHVYVNDHWFVKSTNSSLDRQLVDDEMHYVEDNPHGEALMNIFRLAGIDYGRIDYGLKDGRIQVFEINTNPVVMRTGTPANASRVQRKRHVAAMLVDAFLAIDGDGGAQATRNP